MDMTRFEALIDAYGAAEHRWPADARASLLAFIAAHPEACAPVLSAARALDDRLGQWEVAQPSALLRARIIRAARTAPLARLPTLAALAASLVLGVLLGFGGAESGHQAEAADAAIAALDAADGDGAWTELDG